jgi:hypothetical protein
MTGQADCAHRDFFEAEGNYVCRVCGKILAEAGMTRVTDRHGTRWVKYAKRKRRKPGRAVRFANIKVGDLLALRKSDGDYYNNVIVTDLWFDPVAGERDETAGMMVAIRWLRDGKEFGAKRQHTRRGLAMQGYDYADKVRADHERIAEDVAAVLQRARKGERP